MSGGESGSKSCLYVPLLNYYQHSLKIADETADLARSLTYNQREFDYAWDNDLAGMSVRDGSLVSAGGQVYGEILIPPGAICGPEILKVLHALKQRGARLVVVRPCEGGLRKLDAEVCEAGEVVGRLQPSDSPIAFAPGGLPISVRSRRLDDHSWVTFLLNESKATQTLTMEVQPGWRIQEEDLPQRHRDAERAKADISYNPEHPVNFRSSHQTEEADLVFAPGESKLIFAGQSSGCPSNSRTACQVGQEVPLKDWELQPPKGKPLKLRGRMPSWHELGFGDYSGFMSYSTRFRWDGDTTEATLDLGEVRYAATVWLDERRVGDVVFTPFRILLSGLEKGEHTLRVDVLNTLANSICGTEEREAELEKKGAFIGTYAPLYLPLDRQKIPSGLIGPVVLRGIQNVEVEAGA